MEALKLNQLSVAGYIALEKENDTKYEYHQGEIFALASGTINYSVLCSNIHTELSMALRKKDENCRAYTSEMRLAIEATHSYVYPDAMVICGELEKSTKASHAITNPIVIVEVLSDGSESYDRGDKFFKYRQIPTLKEYILIDQNKAQIDTYRRKGNLWQINRIDGLDAVLKLDAIEIELNLSAIYLDVNFEEESEKDASTPSE